MQHQPAGGHEQPAGNDGTRCRAEVAVVKAQRDLYQVTVVGTAALQVFMDLAGYAAGVDPLEHRG